MKKCLVCLHPGVELVLDLGETALANKFLTKDELSHTEPRYPLRLGFCRNCGHVQLMESVPPQAMFEDYLYVSGASDALKEHLYDLSDIVTQRRKLGSKDLVVDVGCNDATLLQGFRRHGIRTLGVDPAQNLAEFAAPTGIERFVGFFGADTASHIREKWGPASVITLSNTFPHIQDLHGFVSGVLTLLKPGGALVIECHYLMDILDQVAFDTIYHEHVSYWALGPMKKLFEGAGMEIISAERLALHHGQLRVFVQRKGEGTPEASVQEILEQERKAGLEDIKTFLRFRDLTLGIKESLRKLLSELKQSGKRVAGYGAPAKGSTLLGFLEIGPELIEYIVDRSSLKQGRYTPGTHIPVVPNERLIQDQPDYVLLLAWNFLEEVLQQQQEYRARGGKFITPVPTARIVA
jgi:SAM-dependent methyltransferase